MQDISRVLADVPDWKGLAGWLNIRSNDVEIDCAQDVAQASCYRRELIHRYCNRQLSENPYKVAEDIANALKQMDHRLQAQQLRELEFCKSGDKCSSLRVGNVRMCDCLTDKQHGTLEKKRDKQANGEETTPKKETLQGSYIVL